MALRGEAERRETRAAKAASSVRHDKQGGRKFPRSNLPAEKRLRQNRPKGFVPRLRSGAPKTMLPAPTTTRSLPACGKVKSVSTKPPRRPRMRVALQKPLAARERDARRAKPQPTDQAGRAPPQSPTRR